MRITLFSLLLLTTTPLFGANVGVQSPPIIAATLVLPQASCANGVVNVAYVSTEAENPKFQWSVGNGVIVEGQGTASIKFTLNAPGVAGVAVSVESGGVGTAMHALMPVYGGPSVTMQPQSVSVAPGASVTLTIAASNDAVDYEWFEGVSGDTSKRVARGVAAFKTPALTKSTTYWVRVSGQCGSVESQTAMITVIGVGKRRPTGR